MKIKHLILWFLITVGAPYLWGFGIVFNPAIDHQINRQQKNKSSLSVQAVPARKVTQSKKRLNQRQMTEVYTYLVYDYVLRIEKQADQLQIDYPKNQSIQKLVPIVFDLTKRARKEPSMIKAYHLVDCASDLITFGKNLVKGTKAVIKGSVRGLKTVLTPTHYKELSLGLAHAVKAGLEAMSQADELEDIMYCSNSEVTHELVMQHQVILNKEIVERAAQWKLLCNYYEKTPWDQLLETGAEFGTTILFDAIVLNAAGWATTEVGQQLIAKLTKISKSEKLATELTVEVAGLGKLMVEQGEIEALKVIEEAGTLEGAVLKSSKARERIIEFVPVHKIRKDRNIFEGFNVREHIFSEKHKKRGIYKLGSTQDARSEGEIVEKFKQILQKLYDEERLMVGDNQIHTVINNQIAEIRAHFDSDGKLLSINGFAQYSERILGNRIVI